MIGYKAFNSDLTCYEFQYKIGNSYEMCGEIELCKRGFHFCENISDCFSYYRKVDARFAKVEAYGDVIKANEDSKCVTNKIRILEEIPRYKAVEMSNSGNRNSGYCNSGDYNSGNYNSGYCNSGNRNSGAYNSGDWNQSSHNNGCFMTTTPLIMMFNKPTNWTFDDWLKSYARHIMSNCPTKNIDLEWIDSSKMTTEEKAQHPEHTTTGGYLKEIECTSNRQKWWDELCDYDKAEVMSLPNFDANVFYECTGIVVDMEDEEYESIK